MSPQKRKEVAESSAEDRIAALERRKAMLYREKGGLDAKLAQVRQRIAESGDDKTRKELDTRPAEEDS